MSPDENPPLRVVPLFETLDDLDNGPAIMSTLLANPWYREHLRTVHGDHQEVSHGTDSVGGWAGGWERGWAGGWGR